MFKGKMSIWVTAASKSISAFLEWRDDLARWRVRETCWLFKTSMIRIAIYNKEGCWRDWRSRPIEGWFISFKKISWWKCCCRASNESRWNLSENLMFDGRPDAKEFERALEKSSQHGGQHLYLLFRLFCSCGLFFLFCFFSLLLLLCLCLEWKLSWSVNIHG